MILICHKFFFFNCLSILHWNDAKNITGKSFHAKHARFPVDLLIDFCIYIYLTAENDLFVHRLALLNFFSGLSTLLTEIPKCECPKRYECCDEIVHETHILTIQRCSKLNHSNIINVNQPRISRKSVCDSYKCIFFVNFKIRQLSSYQCFNKITFSLLLVQFFAPKKKLWMKSWMAKCLTDFV